MWAHEHDSRAFYIIFFFKRFIFKRYIKGFHLKGNKKYVFGSYSYLYLSQSVSFILHKFLYMLNIFLFNFMPWIFREFRALPPKNCKFSRNKKLNTVQEAIHKLRKGTFNNFVTQKMEFFDLPPAPSTAIEFFFALKTIQCNKISDPLSP